MGGGQLAGWIDARVEGVGRKIKKGREVSGWKNRHMDE